MNLLIGPTQASVSPRKALGVISLLVAFFSVSQADAACTYQQVVCAARNAVFPISGYDPLASGVRIGRDKVVTNRHVAGSEEWLEIKTSKKTIKARVIPSAYAGDLVLLSVEGLSTKTPILQISADSVGPNRKTILYAIGTDISNREVRVFKPGIWTAGPGEDAPLGRIHTTAKMQPGVSGGALINENGELVGISVGGGDGRNEAIPASQIKILQKLTKSREAMKFHFETNQRLIACDKALEAARNTNQGPFRTQSMQILHDRCLVSGNAGQYLEAGNLLGMAGEFKKAIALHQSLVEQVPNSINGRIALLVSLQFAGRINDMLPQATRLFHLIPNSVEAQRFAILVGVWTDDRKLAKDAYDKLTRTNPQHAVKARQFMANPPPKPSPR